MKSRRAFLLASLALLAAACRTPVPTTRPEPTASKTRPAASAVPTSAPSATGAASSPTGAPAPAAPSATRLPPTAAATGTPSARPRILLPDIRNERPPTPQPPAPVPTMAPGTPGPTETPRPTSVPRPTPGPLMPITKVTKWGLGVYREGNEVFQDLYTAKPTVLLLMDPSEGWAKRLRETFPKAFIVARRFRNEVSQPLDNPAARGVAFADMVAQHAVPLKGVVDAWVSYNEVTAKNGYDDYRRYNQFQVSFARRLQDVHGVAAVAGNDGSGTIEPFDYPKYFAEAIQASRFFGVHAYSPPGTRSMRDDAEWNALRYRKIHDELEKAGIRGVKMVMTESGLGNGWLGRLDDAQMAEQFFWFTDELEKDSYVIGHAAYGLFAGLDSQWRDFEMKGTDILTRMGYYEPPARRT